MKTARCPSEAANECENPRKLVLDIQSLSLTVSVCLCLPSSVYGRQIDWHDLVLIFISYVLLHPVFLNIAHNNTHSYLCKGRVMKRTSGRERERESKRVSRPLIFDFICFCSSQDSLFLSIWFCYAALMRLLILCRHRRRRCRRRYCCCCNVI